MKFFVDRSLGEEEVPGALKAAGADVIVHSDLFWDKAPDVLWLTECGRRGYVILTKDHRIRHHEIERRAIIAAKCMAFFLSPRRMTGAAQGRSFVAAIERMKKACLGNKPPFIAFVNGLGGVRGLQRLRR